MRTIGGLAAEVLAGVSSRRELVGRATAEVGVTATTAVAFGKQNELNLGAGRSGIGRIADLGALGEAVKEGIRAPSPRISQGGKRSGRTD